MNKQVLIVRRDLKMSPGKAAAQCAHAAQQFLLQEMEHHGTCAEMIFTRDYQSWQKDGETIVVLGCENDLELLDLWAQAQRDNLPAYVMVDQGRTEIAPNTNTCLAIGPADSSHIDQITGHLRLY